MLILSTASSALHAMIALVHTAKVACAGHLRKTEHPWRNDKERIRYGTMTTTSTSRNNSAVLYGKIDVIQPFDGQEIVGWVTSTLTDTNGIILYGIFPTSDEAMVWASQLLNATIYPIHRPAYNRG